MNKRGVSRQVFMWIFALIVIAIVLYFGVTSLTKLVNVGKTVDTLRFQKDVERDVSLLYGYAPGSNKEVSINAPVGVQGVCFIDFTRNIGVIKYSQLKSVRGLGVTPKNMFFASVQGKRSEPVKIEHLKPKTNPECIDVKHGKIQLMLENKGDHVEVS